MFTRSAILTRTEMLHILYMDKVQAKYHSLQHTEVGMYLEEEKNKLSQKQPLVTLKILSSLSHFSSKSKKMLCFYKINTTKHDTYPTYKLQNKLYLPVVNPPPAPPPKPIGLYLILV